MNLYTDIIATTFKLNPSDDWLCKKQGLALPVLPPTTSEAQQYIFLKCRIMQHWRAVKENGKLTTRLSHENGINMQMENIGSMSQPIC